MQSENISELAKALAAAQGEIKTAGKGKENPFFKSSYADLAAIREACGAALSKNQIAYTQAVNFEGESTWLETTLMHASGQWIMGKYPIRPVKNDPQGVGSAITYAKRYALAAMVGVVAADEDDDGEAASGRAHTNGNGASKPHEPSQPNPKTAATAWATDAIDTIKKFRTLDDLDAWLKPRRDKVASVRDHNESAHKRLVEAIAARSADLSPLNA